MGIEFNHTPMCSAVTVHTVWLSKLHSLIINSVHDCIDYTGSPWEYPKTATYVGVYQHGS